jgi:hypothetical protein
MTSPAGCELYVYYRVPAAQAAAAAQEVLSVQQGLVRQWPALEARLLRKADDPAGPVTWMEVYRHPLGLDADLLARLGAVLADVPSGRTGPRHEEHFVPHR